MKPTPELLWRWLRRGPLTLALAATILVTTTLGSGLSGRLSPHWRRALGDGPGPVGQGHWWTPMTALVAAPSPVIAVGLVLLLVTLGIWMERRLGSWRTLAVGTLAPLLGGLLAASSPALAKLADPAWGRALSRDLHVGCEPWLVAVLMAGSARMDILWRRRIRVSLGMVLLLLAVFGGSYRDIAVLFAGVVGALLGLSMRSREPDRSLAGTRHEFRTLVALAVAGFVVASVASTMAANPVGPLASMRLLFRDVPWDAEQLADVCADPNLVRECRRGTYLLRNASFAAALAGAAPLAALLAMTRGLRHGRRAAWRGALAILGTYLVIWVARLVTMAVAAAHHPGDDTLLGFNARMLPSIRLLLPVVLLSALILLVATSRPRFSVLLPTGAARAAAGRIAAVVAACAGLDVGLGMLWHTNFAPDATPSTLLLDFLLRLCPGGAGGLVQQPLFAATPLAARIAELMPAVPWLWAAVETWRLMGRHSADASSADRARMVDLLTRVGGSTLSWWSTWGEGNRWWFSPSHEAGVAYRVVGDVAVTPCGPACRPEDLRPVVVEFAEWATAHGLTPALYSVHGDVTDVTDALGWTKLEVAEEALLDPRTVEFKGKKFQDIRTAANRAQREGIRVETTTWEQAPLAWRHGIASISEGWVADKGLPEMGFTLGGVEELDDPHVRLHVALDADDRVHGVVSWLPVFRDGQLVGLTLDFMRRRADGFKMSMELLIAHALGEAKAEGLEVLSLSGAPLARVAGDEEAAATWSAALDAGLQRMGGLLEPAYGFRSLLAFKAKFQPTYRPMYLTVPDAADLPAAGRALAQAYVPELSMSEALRISWGLLRRPRPSRGTKPAPANPVSPNPAPTEAARPHTAPATPAPAKAAPSDSAATAPTGEAIPRP